MSPSPPGRGVRVSAGDSPCRRSAVAGRGEGRYPISPISGGESRELILKTTPVPFSCPQINHPDTFSSPPVPFSCPSRCLLLPTMIGKDIMHSIIEWRIRLFVDGACPICQYELRWLRFLDRGRGRIVFEDISDASFEASRFGLDHNRVTRYLHGVLPDGRYVRSMEAFRHAYAAVGWGWLLAPTSWPGLQQSFDAGYRVFAQIRYWLRRRATCKCNSGR